MGFGLFALIVCYLTLRCMFMIILNALARFSARFLRVCLYFTLSSLASLSGSLSLLLHLLLFACFSMSSLLFALSPKVRSAAPSPPQGARPIPQFLSIPFFVVAPRTRFSARKPWRKRIPDHQKRSQPSRVLSLY